MEGNINSNTSFLVVSDDNLTRKISINKSTNLVDFYQKIINYFPNNTSNMRFFYFEGYSHNIEYISNEKEFIIANKKSIEYYYFCPKYSNECIMNEEEKNYDYLKYHSVIVFNPIELINTEYQKNLMKEIKIMKANNNNQKNNLNSNNMYNMNFMMGNMNRMMGNMMNNRMMMNSMNNGMMNNINNRMMGNMMGSMNNGMMCSINNPMRGSMNNPMMRNMMNNPMMNNMNNPMMNNMNNPMMNNMNNPMMFNQFSNMNRMNQMSNIFMLNQINKDYLNQCYQNLISKFQINSRNNRNNKLNGEFFNDNDEVFLKYKTIDTENNPLNKYIENAINFSYAVKTKILQQKSNSPQLFINISETLSHPGLLTSANPTDEDYKYILSLIGKILENNGITVGIYKDYNIKDRIDLASIQFIFSGLINKKKFKLYINANENAMLTMSVDLEFKKKYIDICKNSISNSLNINKKLIILTNCRKEGQYLCMDLAFNPEVGMINEKDIKQKLIGGKIVNCEIIPLLEGCRLSPNIFDFNYNKLYNINQGIQKRGGEDYISPLNWAAYGINVSGIYDFGDNKWLSNNGQNDGEFAVAYYGINNLIHHKMQIVQNIMSLMGNLESGNTFIEENNLRNPGNKCMSGAYFYKNPEYAENSSEVINIGGFDYKIMFMCRVNPNKIRQPQNFPDCWILSPTPDDIRPYKILIKKIPKSPLAMASQQNFKMCTTNPPDSYYQILQNKDESFFNKNNLGLSNLDYALRIYTNGSYINGYLRNGDLMGYSESELKSTVWCLHKAITQTNVVDPVTNGTILYRGVCFKLPNNIGVGTKFYFPEFLSSSRDINVAKSFGNSGTLMYITVKNNGTNGKKIYCRDVEYITSCKGQKEIIFTSYCQFRITQIEKNPTWDIMHLTCEGHYF